MNGNHLVDRKTKTINCPSCDGAGRFSDIREWRDRMRHCDVDFNFKTLLESARTINRLGSCDCDFCEGYGKIEVDA